MHITEHLLTSYDPVGQTPRKIFRNPHPPRFDHGVPTLAIGLMHGIEEDAHLLLQDSKPFSGKHSRYLNSHF